MTVSAAIDQIMGYIENVASGDANNSDRRTRSLQYLQETFNDVYYHAEWWFRWNVFGVTIPANDCAGTLPATFSDLPAESDGGAIFNQNTGTRVWIVRPSRIVELQYDGAKTTDPTECAVFMTDTTTPYSPLLQTQYVSVSTPLDVTAHQKPPVLTDGGGGNDYLARIPDQWHQSVLIPGARMLAQKAKGDVKEWQSHYERGLARMKAAENQVKGANFAVPGFFGW